MWATDFHCMLVSTELKLRHFYWEMDELEIQCMDWGLELNSQNESQESMQWTDNKDTLLYIYKHAPICF